MKLRPHRMARTGPLPKYLLRTVKRDIASPSIGILPTGPANAALNARIFYILASANDVDLFNVVGNLATAGKFIIVINPGVRIGSSSTGSPGLTVGAGWHANAKVWIYNFGDIRGKGGNGGNGSGGNPIAGGTAGTAGGDAFALTRNIVMFNYGTFGGGGGGGGGGQSVQGFTTNLGGGGGGAGAGTTNSSPGGAGTTSGPATPGPSAGQANSGDTPGSGGAGGQETSGTTIFSGSGANGGALGVAGATGNNGNSAIPEAAATAGGAAGKAIALNGFTITFFVQVGSFFGAVS